MLRFSREGVGRLSAGWQRWAEDMLDPKVDWRRVLAAEIRKGVTTVSGRVDYTYRRPSRRASASPDVVCRRWSGPCPRWLVLVRHVRAAWATSELARVLAEVDGLLKGVGLARNRVRVLAVDAAVHTVQRVTSARQVNLVGGGGTDMGAGLDGGGRAAAAAVGGRRAHRRPHPLAGGAAQGHAGRGRPDRRRRPARRGRAWAPPRWARSCTSTTAAPLASRTAMTVPHASLVPPRSRRRRRRSPCEGEEHRVTWRRGKFVLEDHDLGAERAMLALGGEPCPCMRALELWVEPFRMPPDQFERDAPARGRPGRPLPQEFDVPRRWG